MRDISCHSFRNASYLCKPFRFFLHDAQAVFFKFLHNPFRNGLSYPLHRTGSKILLNPCQGIRRKQCKALYKKLLSVNGMFLPPALHLYSFRHRNMGEVAYTSDFFSLIRYRKNRISAIFASKYDVADASL